MKHSLRYILFLFASVFLLQSCEEEPDLSVYTTGELKTNDVLFLGDDLTAGYSNFGWSRAKQEQAFPIVFLEHLNNWQSAPMDAPFLPGQVNTGGWSVSGFNWSNCTESRKYPVFDSEGWNVSSLNQVYDQAPFNVIGIPRLRFDQAWETDLYYRNPFFNRLISPNSPDANLVELVQGRKPDFFVLHFGQSDLMRFALNGGVDAIGNPIELMSNLDFERQIDSLIQVLKDEENIGVLINIPLPEYLPYFHTVPNEFIDPQTCLSTGQPYFIETETGKVKEAGKWDKILLPAAGGLNQPTQSGGLLGMTESSAVPDDQVLDKAEYMFINNKALEWNVILKLAAERNGLLYLDLNDLYKDIHDGQKYFGASFNSEYMIGNFFDIDGISPLPKGHAMIANRLIELLNEEVHCNLPAIDILSR